MSVDFFDSNLVYLFDETNETKRSKAELLLSHALEHSTGCISFQVVQETLNVIARKLNSDVSLDEATRFLEAVLVPLWRVMPSPDLYRAALKIRDSYSYSFYDSLIIAAAEAAGCNRLYTEDLQDGQIIGRVTIENPFRAQ